MERMIRLSIQSLVKQEVSAILDENHFNFSKSTEAMIINQLILDINIKVEHGELSHDNEESILAYIYAHAFEVATDFVRS
jgi:hypothetical protein